MNIISLGKPADGNGTTTGTHSPLVGLVTGAIVIVLAAVFAIGFFLQEADSAHQGETILANLEGDAYALSALEWQAIASQQISPDTIKRMEQLKGQMQLYIRQLPGFNRELHHLEGVSAKLQLYLDALKQEIIFIKTGRIDEALKEDKLRVDPAFEALIATIDGMAIVYKDIIHNTTTNAKVSTIGILLFTTASLLVLAWHYNRANLAFELARAEHVLLQQINERIEHELAERKRVEAALSENETLLRESQVIAGLGSYVLDMATGVWRSSDVLDNLLGINKAYERSMEGLARLIHPNDRESALDYLKIQAPGGVRTFDKEFRIIRHDNQTERWIHSIVRLEVNAEGRPVKLHGTIQDITESKAAEVALRESEESYRALFDRSIDGIFIMSDDGTLIAVNESFARMHGYRVKEMIHMNLWDLDTPETAQMIPERMRRLMSGEALTFEVEHYHKDGHVFPLEVSSSLIISRGKSFIQSCHRDITERRRAELEKDKLEAQNRQLQKAESLGRMAGAIAHHFNNHLMAVMMNLEMAIKELTPRADSIETLNDAMQSAHKAAEVSSLMLTYLGQTHCLFEPQDLSEVCRRSLTMIRAAIPKDIVLETHFPTPGPSIHANANQIQQVLTNLVTNAWEAMAEGKGSIRLNIMTVSREAIPESNRFPIDCSLEEMNYACLDVADEGCGIADKDFEKLFEPFFSNKFSGRGLGLPVVLGIVRSHHGVITVESEHGRGSVFRVFLPISAEVAPLKPELEAPSPKMAGSGTVLVVEDEMFLRRVVTKTLKGMGFAVIEAQDGVEAVEVFRRHQSEICLVLSDLSMPRMDGWETLTALRRIAPGIRFILSSGYSEAQVMEGDHPERPHSFLNKPYEYKKLREAVYEVLNRKLEPTGNG